MSDAARGPADLSMLDSLTGLYNRRALFAALRERVPTGHGALVLLDLDNFKSIVERIGADNADRVLLDVAGRFLSCVDPDPLLYRYAGDSYGLLLPDADRDRGAAVAETLRAAIEREAFAIHDRLGPSPVVVPITASAAVAAYPTDARSPAALIECGERALFVAKHTGRNRVAVAGRLDPSALAEIGIFRGLPCPVFVGRGPEQSRLRQLAASAREVGPQVAVVTGPPGIGKSRLLQEFGRWARPEGFMILAASCPETRENTPYATLTEQIERLLTTERAKVMGVYERLSAVHRTALAGLSHELPPPDPAPPESELAEQGKLTLEACVTLLEGLAGVGALIIVADEVEHADEGSIEVYRVALERRLPMMLVATSDIAWSDFERTWMGELVRDRESTTARLTLDPLAAEDIRQMLSAILPDADVAPDAVEQLVTCSAGNPLYIEETVRALLLRGQLKLTNGRWTLPPLTTADLSKDLEGAIRAVAAALPPGANWLLTRAAVIGTRVDAELLQEVLGQREAETLDFIDEARRARLLLPGEGEEEILSFPASHARRVRLATGDAAEQKVIHGRVGVVQEARHGGDTSHIADELAYHYRSAGEETRAQHFDAVARRRAALIQPPRRKGSRRPRMAPATEALSPAATDHALAMLRHFTAAVKNRRLYPQWSQVAAQFMAQVRGSLEALMAAAPGFTIASTPFGPTLNGVASTAMVAMDFLALLDERLVESITIMREFDPARLEKVVDAFVAPFDRLRAAPDHWDRFLAHEKLEAVDVVQKAFEAQPTQLHQKARHGDQPVPPEHLPAVRDALRFLKAGVDNLKLYPPGHPLVDESAVQACKSMMELIALVPAITLGIAEDELVINGMPADKKFFSEAGSWLAREIDQREFKSISLWQGLKEDEVRALVSALSMAVGDLQRAEVREGLMAQFTHIAVALLSYERAQTGGEEHQILKPPPRPIRAELRARTHLARPYDKFLTIELEHEFHVLVEALTYGAGRPLAEQLVDRLGEHFHDKALAHRRQSYRLLEHAIAYASPSTRQLEVARSAPPLRLRLAEDTGPLHFQAAANLLPIWVPAAVTSNCLRELSEIASRTLRKRLEAADTPPELRKMCEQGLLQILESRAFERIIAAARKTQEADRRAAIEILLAIGGSARRQLVEVLAEEPDATARRALAGALAPTVEALASDFAAVLKPESAPERLVRVLEVADVLQSPSLAVPLAALLDQGAPAVRREVLRVAQKGPRSLTLAVVRRLLANSDSTDRGEGIEIAGTMKLTEVSAEIGRILEETEDEEQLVRCCKYFAGAPNMAVVPTLVEIARMRPRLFGLVKGYRAETRAAAVLALAAQGTPQAQEAIEKAVADPEVRALANM
ncbi:MAG: diguanylate cyclase [Planctomycetes bacterium]|nr:diguanylate cyclase [Planctomycetota bacterium]